ncbi:uncharacterized protein LOC129916623 isoform X2 [Episyrphus balteatus]|uniref:uncharacterized protein LOC129916623 isoform X2 n=1 Tax=Episyrphus balteatus TaxID=286459 RepID=UPI0024850771|nr:uncharacterized protein LOC129916623 isoform X2 [Episyrphus balteatus]
MQSRVLYAFRGWIAFVAFMDFGTAFRCYVEKRSFLSQNTEIDNIEIGMYCILKAIALVHCTLFIHHKPIVMIGRCSIVLTMILYSTEALYYRSTTINFYVLFPFSLNFITLVGLFYIPRRLRLWDPFNTKDDENNLLIKQMVTFKRRKIRKLS